MVLNGQGIRASYLIGTPVGLMTIFIVFSIPVMLSGEGLATMAIVAVYGKAILGMIISFLIALGIGGHNASADLKKQKSLLKTSFKYSLTVNTIIWTVFITLIILYNEKKDIWLFLAPPIIAFILCTLFSTFTIGLLICNTIKKTIVLNAKHNI